MRRGIIVGIGASLVAAGLVVACGDVDDFVPPTTLLDGSVDAPRGNVDTDGASHDARTADVVVAPSDAGIADAQVIAPPTANPPPGTYTIAQCVLLSAAEGEVRGTLDGAVPTASSPVLGVVTVTQNTPIRAIAVTDGGTSSEAFFVYVINSFDDPIQDPYPTPEEGSYDASVSVALADNLTSATICYTLDGTTPDCVIDTKSCIDATETCVHGITYDGGAIALAGDAGITVKVRALACKVGTHGSGTRQATYTF